MLEKCITRPKKLSNHYLMVLSHKKTLMISRRSLVNCGMCNFPINVQSCSCSISDGQGLNSNTMDKYLTRQLLDTKVDLVHHASQALLRADLGEGDLRGLFKQHLLLKL